MPAARDKTPRSTEHVRPTPAPLQTIAGPAVEIAAARLHALVISDKLVATYPLPDSGVIKIGRSPQCEIQIDEVNVSRVHASLTIGPPLAITDLRSANGTRVRARAIAADMPIEIAPGETIQVGTATIIVQRQVAAIRPRRLWTHDYFEVRLEEECARAARRNATFAVMRVSCSSPTGTSFHQAVTELARMSDVVGEYGPADYEILLVDTEIENVVLAEQRIQGALEAQGITARIGTACYPRDGRNSDELMSRAEAAARGEAQPGSRPRVDPVAERTMQDLYTLAGRIANGTISVLILGETGVGKEVLAAKVHNLSPRANKPYLRLNCAALTETLLESELFGYERGAFTGAVGTKQGLLETADGGSVFLDEVGELPMSTQVKLLRVIEERVVTRVGGLKPRPLDVRFIAATNRDLEAEIARDSFRQDLFFRLNGATLVIPPLRERVDEIPVLARAFLEAAARSVGLARPPVLSAEAMDALLLYSWPGNIRELRNMIERAVLLSGEAPIVAKHLPLEKMRVTFASLAPAKRNPIHPAPAAPAAPPTAPAENPKLTAGAIVPILRSGPKITADEERAQIEQALQACGGNQTRAAKLLGIARRTLINRVKEFGLARPRGVR